MPDLHDVEVELTRVVDRLNSMPLNRAAAASSECRDTALLLVERTRQLDADVPPDAALPELAPQGLGAMLSVLGHDYLAAAAAHPEADVQPVLERLTALRRALP